MKNMKKWIAGIAISMFALVGSVGSADAITIDLIQNGGFEEGGGSLAYWHTYGDVGLVTEGSGNHIARIGQYVVQGNGLITQLFNIKRWYDNTSQTLAFDYNFTTNNMSTSFFDIFANYITEDPLTKNVVEVPLLLASYQTTGSWSQHSALLNPQLVPGWYFLKFKLTESNGSVTDSYLDLDNISLTVNTTSVPEPNILLLLGSALVGAAAIGRGGRGLRNKGK